MGRIIGLTGRGRVFGKPEFFDAVRAYMKAERINQTELAGRMGVTQSTISRMLRDKNSPSVDTLDKLAAVMNREVADLLYLYLGKPLPSVYEMANRVAALSDERRAQATSFALYLLKEQQESEKHEQSVKSEPHKNVR